MAVGIQVYNDGGTLVFDTDDYVMRMLGKINFNGNDGSVTNSLINQNNYFVFPDNTTLAIPVDTNFVVPMPYFYVTGNTLCWESNNSTSRGTYIYGVKI